MPPPATTGPQDQPSVGRATEPRARSRLGLGSRAVLIPVKDFAVAKRRLAPALGPAERAALARTMAERVVRAARGLPVAVVCDSTTVAHWALGVGALVVWAPERGLNGAVQEGVAHFAGQGVAQVTVAHADLPLAQDLEAVGAWPGVTLVPDRRDDGTNVIALPVDCGFVFSYGPGSFGRHRAEAARLGLPTRIERTPALTWDVDLPADLSAVVR